MLNLYSEDKIKFGVFEYLGYEQTKAKYEPLVKYLNDKLEKELVLEILSQDEIDSNKWPVKILLSVYDEIQCECREDLAEQWKSKLEEIMIKSAETILKKVPIKVDCKTSSYWTK